MKELDEITGAIVDASMKIHMELGPGLLESVYEAVLARALEKRGFQVERQKAVRFEYDGMVFEPLCQACEGLVAADAAVVAHGKCRRIDVVVRVIDIEWKI